MFVFIYPSCVINGMQIWSVVYRLGFLQSRYQHFNIFNQVTSNVAYRFKYYTNVIELSYKAFCLLYYVIVC